MSTSSPSPRRKLLAMVLLLVVADGVLIAAFAFRGEAPRAQAPVEIDPADPRVASVFRTLDAAGLAAALDSLEQRASADSLVLRGGHQLTHALGRRALLRSGGDVGILRSCRSAFASGCYHGVVEGLLTLRARIDMPDLQRICAVAGGGDAPGPVYECVHGLGHGVVGALAMDVGAALRHCDSLEGTNFITSCHEGVFMEAIASTFRPAGNHAGHPHGVRQHNHPAAVATEPGDPYGPCRWYSDPYAESCWLFQGFVILRRVDFEPGLALAICDNAPGGRAGRCYESVGHQLAGLFQRGDSWIIEQCGKGRPDLVPRCAAGAALALASLDWSGRRVVGFCSAVPDAWVTSCQRTAARALALVASVPDQAALCNSHQPHEARVCPRRAEPRQEM